MNHNKNNDELQDAINRIETSVKNSQDGIKKLFLHTTRQELAIEALDNKFDALENKFETLENKFETMENKFETLENKFETLENKFDALDNKVDANQRENCKRFDKIEETLSIIVNHLKK